MLNVERLQALCAVADLGSISAASAHLHRTASGVSQQLAKLENEVGVALLVHVGRGIALTHAGRLLAQRGRAILAAMAEAKDAVASLERETIGELRLASFPSACRFVMPHAICSLRAQHPALDVSYSSGTTDALLTALQRSEVDLVVAESLATMRLRVPNDVAQVHLREDLIDVALPRNHRGVAEECVSLSDLAEMTWVTWQRDEVFHLWLEQVLRGAGAIPRIPFEVPDFSAQFEFVANGFAAALVPRLIRAWVPDTVALLSVQPTLKRDIVALTKRNDGRPSVRAGMEAVIHAFSCWDLLNAQASEAITRCARGFHDTF